MADNQVMLDAYGNEDVIMLDTPQIVTGGPANAVIIPDEIVHHHPAANVAEAAHRNPVHTRKERWGYPLTSRPRTQYPPYFSAKLQELISYIPHQRGYNIRPVIVEILQQNFTEDQIVDISGVLTLARPNVLKSMARILVEIIQQCYDSPQGQIIGMGEVLMDSPDRDRTNTLNWFWRLEDNQLQTAMRTPYTAEHLYHLFSAHTYFIPRPTPDVPVQVGIEPCSLYQPESPRRTLQQVQAFVNSLPVVPRQALGEDDTCTICFELFYEPEDEIEGFLDGVENVSSVVNEQIQDRPVRLPCFHVFGKLCLTELFKPMDNAALEHKNCPMCRAPLDALIA